MKRFWKGILGVVLILLLTVGGYVAYVFVRYDRLPDDLALAVEPLTGGSGGVAQGYRLVSYNVGFGAYSSDYSFFMDGGKESRARSAQAVQDNLHGALDAAAALEPDFLFLQEVDVDGTRSFHIDQWALAKDALSDRFASGVFAQNYDSPYLFWPLRAPHGANRAGLGTFSRYPISSALRRSLPVEAGVMKLLDLDRCYSVARVPLEQGELVLYNLHLSAYTSDGTIANEQLALLLADMQAEFLRGNWCVAGGDFNKDLLGDGGATFGVTGPEYTWAQPIPEGMIPQGIALIAPLDGEDPVPSCRNADQPYGPDDFCVTVDGFLVTDNVAVQDAGVWDTAFQFSDHNPVYLDFELR